MSDKKVELESPINEVPLVGPKYSKRLERLNIETVEDLLFHIPFRYKDTSKVLTIKEFKEAGEGMVLATVDSVSSFRAKRYFIIKAKVSDESGTVEIVWFNQPYLKTQIREGKTFLFEGKLSKKGRYENINSPEFQDYEKESVHLGRITPFYEGTHGVSSKWLRSRINFLKDHIDRLVDDPLPPQVLKKNDLLSLDEAVYKIHFPETFEEVVEARKRLGTDELLRIGIKLERKRKERDKFTAPEIKVDEKLIRNFKKTLKFILTEDQETALDEILHDISNDLPMNRLLNGDVGSGKTILAVIASYLTVKNGYSVLLMAPTTILAQQHFNTFKKYFNKLPGEDVKVQLLSSGMMLEPTMFENRQIIIGTQALLFEEYLPEKVGMIIVDEEHRFGVKQRNILDKNQILTETEQKRDLYPHYLSLTATPIPRTLTNIFYGDTDVSFIKTMPKDRKPVQTHYVPFRKRASCFEWVRDKIVDSNNNERAFIIFPLVEESEKVDARAAVEEHERLSGGVFKKLSVGLLHGRMKQEEKDEKLMNFKEGKFDILVATSVVEVGIDISDATIMVIDSAERFGLAQLHQFRGRVGRGDKQSYCYVIASSDAGKGGKADKRLKYFAGHNSGFDVAEYDLSLRGPGEVYGTQQSGIPNLKVADITDMEELAKAKSIASTLLGEYTAEEIDGILLNLFN